MAPTRRDLAVEAGVSFKVVSEMLGYTDVSTTLRIQPHVLEGTRAQATSGMD